MRAGWLAGVLCAILQPMALAAPGGRLTLDDLLAEEGVVSAAVSPSGEHFAAILRHADHDLLMLFEADSGISKGLTKIGRKEIGAGYEARITSVYWKSGERLLFRVSVTRAPGTRGRWTAADQRRLGQRLFAMDPDGNNLVRMLEKNRELELDAALDLGAIRSFLVNDPDHILMLVDGKEGRSLFKVNVRSGIGEVVEHAHAQVWDWWLDLDGRPVVRVNVAQGYLRFFRRNERGEWQLFHSVRMRELQSLSEYEPLGPSNKPGKYYVLARPETAERRGVYLYDLERESFGAPLVDHPRYDLAAAHISRDGRHVQRYCYYAHVYVCETTEFNLDAHLKAVRRFFKDSANVDIYDSSEDNQTLLLRVDGPGDAPAFYWYQRESRQIQRIGLQIGATAGKLLPTASMVAYEARDGMQLHGYLTRPPGAEHAAGLPLVMLPHGGPEARDHLAFNTWVQFLAAQGYAVFQPNFRGSDGFGRRFSEASYGEWGRKAQDDISDALAVLVDRRIVDPTRVCIMGASYGGYAALAGVTLTPDLYRCAISLSGVSDLPDLLKFERRRIGADSAVYAYWVRQIGDPDRDAKRIAAVSPSSLADRVRAPVLLIHGEEDTIVPFEQSAVMKKRLDRSGRRAILIRLEDEGHSYWSDGSQRTALNAIDDFLKSSIGPGFESGAETKP